MTSSNGSPTTRTTTTPWSGSRRGPRHFARVFRDEIGCTPAAYVERVRVEVARRLLETTALPAPDVTRAAGFGTTETLRRAFARRVGVSPSEYRDRFRPAQLTAS